STKWTKPGWPVNPRSADRSRDCRDSAIGAWLLRLGESSPHRGLLPAAHHGDFDHVAGLFSFDRVQKFLGGGNSGSGGTYDQISCRAIELRGFVDKRALAALVAADLGTAQSCLLGRAPGHEGGNQQAMFGFVDARDAQVGAYHAALLDELRQEPLKRARGNG